MPDKTTVAGELPPLPGKTHLGPCAGNAAVYTADQMRAYATAALAQKDGEIAALKALIEAAYREGYDTGAFCMDESAKPYKYVEADWLKSNARAALGSQA